MKKRITTIFTLCMVVTFVFLFTGCSVEKIKTEKLRDIDFTVIDDEDIPEAVMGLDEEEV